MLQVEDEETVESLLHSPQLVINVGLFEVHKVSKLAQGNIPA
jgi:hypothetical protein